ncbi:MAG: hypothetical protein JOZ90_01915 [Alphaproteobacteria bacterium]|nr:hypothetical protein [Alphaproteobacteria bacterium]MBV9370760.1 hypothetical protein [Alphaproteobacteria bacterium]MBV9899833.1 hypothetical protein [Alphaproteobacteria bacterium]
MSRARPDASGALLRAIRQAVAGFRVDFQLEELRSRSWASVTFAGARHELAFRLGGAEAGAAAAALVRGLNAAEFRLRGHILADIALTSEEHKEGTARLALEALTVEDG